MGCLHLMGLFSCQEDNDGSTVDIANREEQPILMSVGVSTLISDSGVIRYKIISEDWFIYDRTIPQYYSFEISFPKSESYQIYVRNSSYDACCRNNDGSRFKVRRPEN